MIREKEESVGKYQQNEKILEYQLQDLKSKWEQEVESRGDLVKGLNEIREEKEVLVLSQTSLATHLDLLTNQTLPHLEQQLHGSQRQNDQLREEMQILEQVMDEQVQAIEKEYQHLFSVKSDKYDQLKAKVRGLRKDLESKRQ